MGFLSARQPLSGCRHCVNCAGMTVCRNDSSLQNMWPAGLQSPTVYYMLRERQLQFNIQCATMEGPSVWRRHSVAGAAPADLLQRRGRPQLALRLPTTPGSGVQPGDSVVYVRAVPAARSSSKPPRPMQAAPATAAASAAPCLQRQDTPPQLREPATKRSRVSEGAVAAAQPMQLARAASAPGHLAGDCLAGITISLPRSASSSRSVSAASSPVSTAAARPSSPLVALLRRLRDMMSPARPLGVSAY